MSTARGLALLLTADGVLDFRPDEAGGDTFLGDWAPSPDDAVLLVDTAGLPGALVDDTDPHGIQASARSRFYGDAVDRLIDIYEQLHGRHDVELDDGVWLHSVTAEQASPTSLGRDSQDRYIVAINFIAQVRVPVPHRKA